MSCMANWGGAALRCSCPCQPKGMYVVYMYVCVRCFALVPWRQLPCWGPAQHSGSRDGRHAKRTTQQCFKPYHCLACVTCLSKRAYRTMGAGGRRSPGQAYSQASGLSCATLGRCTWLRACQCPLGNWPPRQSLAGDMQDNRCFFFVALLSGNGSIVIPRNRCICNARRAAFFAPAFFDVDRASFRLMLPMYDVVDQLASICICHDNATPKTAEVAGDALARSSFMQCTRDIWLVCWCSPAVRNPMRPEKGLHVMNLLAGNRTSQREKADRAA